VDELFDARDVERVFSASRGVPRKLNTICDNALILAFARGRLPVTANDVSEAIRAVLGKEPLRCRAGLVPASSRVPCAPQHSRCRAGSVPASSPVPCSSHV
jgi:hypothetical protein